MDAFGIGVALQAQARIFFQMMRGQGRTTQLLAALKDGDRVIFTNAQESRRFERLARDIDLKIECIAVATVHPSAVVEKLRERGTPKGRLVFDHSWVELHFSKALEHASADLEYLEKQFGGYGEPHIETRLKAVELARWAV